MKLSKREVTDIAIPAGEVQEGSLAPPTDGLLGVRVCLTRTKKPPGQVTWRTPVLIGFTRQSQLDSPMSSDDCSDSSPANSPLAIILS